MIKALFLSLCLLLAAGSSFGQSRKVKKLAKKQADMLCNCVGIKQFMQISEELKANPAAETELRPRMQMAFMEMMKCTKEINKEIGALSPEEAKQFQELAGKYMEKSCPELMNIQPK